MTTSTLPPEAHQLLKTVFGYDRFRPLQEEIISSVMAKKDTLVLMPTGGGKSMCFQLPALMTEGVCLVVSPLIALMKDQVEALKAYGVGAAAYNSTLTQHQASQVLQECRDGKVKLLYVSPEKLIGNISYFKSQFNISFVAIDEAHCISSWGHDFRPEYTQLKNIRETLPDIPVIALTATADKTTRKDIVQQLGMQDPQVYVSSFDRPNLSLTVRSGLTKKDKMKDIDAFLQEHSEEAGIIYCLSRKNTEDMAADLKALGYQAECYHAGLDNATRNKVQEDFLNDRIQIVCATIAFGMGIDKSNVRWIIHSNLPKNMEGYYQEIGRAGRDGAKADTILYYSYGDVAMMTKYAAESGQRELNLAKLERMQQYAEAGICRRRILLSYFGETVVHNCNNCDICANPPQFIDALRPAQMAISASLRVKEEAGGNMLIDILRGSAKAELLEKNFHQIKTYGAGKEFSFAEWQHFFLQFLHLGLFEIAYDQNSALKVTELGRKVIYENHAVQITAFNRERFTTNGKAAKAKIIKDDTLSQEEKLFRLLRSLRMQLSQQDNVPPYVIFSDATLREMCDSLPVTEEDMLTVSGVGQRKMEMYGKEFLQVIQEFTNTVPKKKVEKGDTYKVTLEMYQRGMDVAAISAERGLAETTVWSHLAYLAEKGEPIRLDQFVTRSERDRIEEALQATGATTAMKPVFEYMNGEIEYHKIRLAMTLKKMEG